MENAAYSALKKRLEDMYVKTTFKFVPYSQSENAKLPKPWRSLNWEVTIQRGKQKITDIYAMGLGHVPSYKNPPDKLRRDCLANERNIVIELETGKSFGKPIPPPDATTVVARFLQDSYTALSLTFESWANEYGFDSDSRRAERIYNELRDIGSNLSEMFGLTEFNELYILAIEADQ